MPNSIYIDEMKRTKQPLFTGCFFKRKNHPDNVWMGVQMGGQYALVSLERGTYLNIPTSTPEKAFGVEGRQAFDQITSTITIVPEL